MNKEIDAVKLQRDIREELGEKYRSDPQGFIRELSNKYGGLRGENSDKAPVGSTSNSQ